MNGVHLSKGAPMSSYLEKKKPDKNEIIDYIHGPGRTETKQCTCYNTYSLRNSRKLEKLNRGAVALICEFPCCNEDLDFHTCLRLD